MRPLLSRPEYLEAKMPIEAFNDIPRRPLPQREGIGGFNDLRSIAALQVGVGNRAFKSDESGIWLGAHKWADAPFRVDMQGNVVATSATFAAYASQSDLSDLEDEALLKAGTSQALTGDIQVGVGNVKIDGANKRILINDGSDDRILIGYQSGGF